MPAVFSGAERNVWTLRLDDPSERLKLLVESEFLRLPSGAFVTFLLNVVSALVALLTSYYSFKVNRLVVNPVLRAISLGFMLLGVGLALDAGTSLLSGRTLVESYAERLLVLFASFSYLTIQMVAYLVIALGYSRAAFGGSPQNAAPLVLAGAAALGLYSYSVLSYLVVLILLAVVIFQGFLVHSGKSGKFSSAVLLGFGLILVAHLVLLLSVLTLGPGLFLIGTAVQFLGFVSLLVFVVRSEVVAPG